MAVYSDEKIEFFDRAKRDKNYKMNTAHFHDKHELYILEKGRTKYFVDNEIYLTRFTRSINFPIDSFCLSKPVLCTTIAAKLAIWN